MWDEDVNKTIDLEKLYRDDDLSPEYRKEYEDAISGFREGLGAHESSERTFFRGDSVEGGRSGHLEYESRFERMAASEQFLYRITDDGAKLIWYYVSDAAPA